MPHTPHTSHTPPRNTCAKCAKCATSFTQKTAIGTALAAAAAYATETSPFNAYFALDTENKKIGFLVCTRENMNAVYELETFELANGCLQSKFLHTPTSEYIQIKGSYRTLARREYRFYPCTTQKLQHYISNMPVNTMGSTLDAANNTMKGPVTHRTIYWQDINTDEETENTNVNDANTPQWAPDSVKRMLYMRRFVARLFSFKEGREEHDFQNDA